VDTVIFDDAKAAAVGDNQLTRPCAAGNEQVGYDQHCSISVCASAGQNIPGKRGEDGEVDIVDIEAVDTFQDIFQAGTSGARARTAVCKLVIKKLAARPCPMASATTKP